MLTYDQVLSDIRSGKFQPECIDHRDFGRLAEFVKSEDLPILGYELKEGVEWTTKAWTRDNILQQLREDVEFGMHKTRGQRGVSAEMMYHCVNMWLYILEEQIGEPYRSYGMPLFRAAAEKYGVDD